MTLRCARCQARLPDERLASGEPTCIGCGSRNQIRAYAALMAPTHAASIVELAAEGEAACFDHAGRRAVGSCARCGRYLCRLCEVDVKGVTRCPSCVALASSVSAFATSRNLFDSTALILPLVSLLVYPLTLIAAPASLVLSVLKWNSPLSLVRQYRWRFVAAMLISTGEIVGWTALIAALVSGRLAVPR